MQKLFDFLDSSPTPFHATANMAQALQQAGFSALDEQQPWQLQAGGKYYVTRNDSSLIAFVTGADMAASGIHMVGAHTDSPCLKVKPQPETSRHGYWQLGV